MPMPIICCKMHGRMFIVWLTNMNEPRILTAWSVGPVSRMIWCNVSDSWKKWDRYRRHCQDTERTNPRKKINFGVSVSIILMDTAQDNQISMLTIREDEVVHSQLIPQSSEMLISDHVCLIAPRGAKSRSSIQVTITWFDISVPSYGLRSSSGHICRIASYVLWGYRRTVSVTLLWVIPEI